MNHKPVLYSRIVRSGETPALVSFLIKNKVVRTETQAMCFLLFIVAISSALAVYFFLSLRGTPTGPVSFVGVRPAPQLP